MADLLLASEYVPERSVREMAAMNASMLLERGRRYAPITEGKIDSKELIDKELREAMRRSRDLTFLLQEDPSFLAWL